MALNLTKRPCKIGSSINTRTEKHGEDDVPACDIPIEGIMLEKDELNQLLGEPYAHRALFNTRGKVFEPMFTQLKDFVLRDKYEKGGLTIWLGLGDDREQERFGDVRLARITLEPVTGGQTAMSLQVQCCPEAEQLAKLFTHLNSSAHCSIRFGKVEEKRKAQPQLPIGDAPDGDDEDSEIVRGPLDDRPAA